MSSPRWPRRLLPRVCARAWPWARHLGGNGIVTDFEMAEVFADAEAIYSYEGTHEINTLAPAGLSGISAVCL